MGKQGTLLLRANRLALLADVAIERASEQLVARHGGVHRVCERGGITMPFLLLIK